jgi:hypothetical protein
MHRFVLQMHCHRRYDVMCKGSIQLYQHEWNWENEKLYGNTTPEGRSIFIQFRVFPTSTSADITIYQYGKNVLYFFYNIAMSKVRRIRKISVFTSDRKFPVLTSSYINTALNQSAFRIYKSYIKKLINNS